MIYRTPPPLRVVLDAEINHFIFSVDVKRSDEMGYGKL